MKKLFALIFALMMVFLFIGCDTSSLPEPSRIEPVEAADTQENDKDTEEAERVEGARDEALNGAASLHRAGDTFGAWRKLSSLSDVYINDCVEKYIRHYGATFLLSARTRVEVEYDRIDRLHRIVPRGLVPESLTFRQDRNISPSIVKHDSDSFRGSLQMAFGFVQDNWLFIDRLVIDYDGKQSTFNISWSQRNSRVLDGGRGIAEWYTVIHSPNPAQHRSTLIESMISADNVTIRFGGDRGRRDFEIPESHLNELAVLWKIYNIVERNLNLMPYLTDESIRTVAGSEVEPQALLTYSDINYGTVLHSELGHTVSLGDNFEDVVSRLGDGRESATTARQFTFRDGLVVAFDGDVVTFIHVPDQLWVARHGIRVGSNIQDLFENYGYVNAPVEAFELGGLVLERRHALYWVDQDHNIVEDVFSSMYFIGFSISTDGTDVVSSFVISK